VLAGTALAHPPPPPDPVETEPPAKTTLIEWSTWLRGGFVVASGDVTTNVARTTTPPPPREADRHVSGAIGGGFTLPVGSSTRIGAWVELRGWQLPLAGGELLVLPGDLDMFFYKGKSAVSLRAGGNPDLWTGQVGVHYRAPWNLFGDQPRGSRYMIGVGIVATATRSRIDPQDWSATIGLEFEPVGALRYVLGIRSWYH
jgi:hypothetical protein